MDCELAVKIDVDTLKGYMETMPRLLDLLGERKIRASVFFSTGPENSSGMLQKILQKGLFAKILRQETPPIVFSNPDIMKRTLNEGHDCGIRRWDGVRWKETLPKMSREEIRQDLTKSVEVFSGVAGTPPQCASSPGFQVSVDSLTVQDELGFVYCSDVRGKYPFLPQMGGVVFRTLQIPATLPPFDGLRQMGMDVETVHDRYLDLLEPGLNVCTIRGEKYDDAADALFRKFFDCCIEGEIPFVTLRDVALRHRGRTDLGICDVGLESVPGFAGQVGLQQVGLQKEVPLP
ncbi:MAG: polysaccharide deacetylase family protein [Synergistaceae bacterium]|nr:polysaccharide deacetylase family protein [Synergistaceae bacterium]